MSCSLIVDNFLEYLENIKNYSNLTINSYKKDILEFNNYVINNKFSQDLVQIRNDRVCRSYISYLSKKNLKETSINRKICSLRSFYNYLIKKNIIKNNYFKNIEGFRVKKKLPNTLTLHEVYRIIDSLDKSNKINYRNYIIFLLFIQTGIRVSELCNIKIDDINFSNCTINIFGKGKKERIVIFNESFKEDLIYYIKEIIPLFLIVSKRLGNNYLFFNKNGLLLTQRGVRVILKNIILKLGDNFKISPHTLRHTFASIMINNGFNLRDIQTILGHKNITTTQIYTHINFKGLQKEYDKLHPLSMKDNNV